MVDDVVARQAFVEVRMALRAEVGGVDLDVTGLRRRRDRPWSRLCGVRSRGRCSHRCNPRRAVGGRGHRRLLHGCARGSERVGRILRLGGLRRRNVRRCGLRLEPLLRCLQLLRLVVRRLVLRLGERGDLRRKRGLLHHGLRRELWLLRDRLRPRLLRLLRLRLRNGERIGLGRRRRGRDLRRLGGLLLRLRGARELREHVHERERAGDRFHRRADGREIRRSRLELGERLAHVLERDVRVRDEGCAVRLLDLVERAHRLRDRRGELHELRRQVRVGLQRAETFGKVFSRRARGRCRVGHEGAMITKLCPQGQSCRRRRRERRRSTFLLVRLLVQEGPRGGLRG